jgi:hypothetical protein
MLAGGYWVVRAALHPNGDGTPTPTTTFSERCAGRSVGRVVEARLAQDRLEALLGSATPPAAADPKAVARLEDVRRRAGAGAGAAPADGRTDVAMTTTAADSAYVIATIRSHAATLGERITARLGTCDVRRRLVAEARQLTTLRPLERRQQVETIVAAGWMQTDWPAVVKRWTEMMEKDRVLAAVWARLAAERKGKADAQGSPATSLSAHLELALDVDTLPGAVARQIADDVTVEGMPAAELELGGNDLALRLTWAGTAVLFCGMWVAMVAIGSWQIYTLLLRPWRTLVITFVAAIAAFSWFWYADAGRLEILGPLLEQLDAENGTSITCASHWLMGLTGVALIAMIAAMTAITYHDDPGLLKSQLEGLRLTFNAAAALLVVGALEVAALYGWAGASFEASPGGLSKAASASAGLAGAFFSAVLLVIYLPAGSVLRERSLRAGETSLLADQGFNSPFQLFTRLLQALAPLFAALPFSALMALLQ